MDLDDLDNEPTQAPLRTSKFAPKSKFQPKSKQPPKPKQEPAAITEPPPIQDSTPPPEPPTAVAVKKEEEPPVASTASEKMDCDEHGGGDVGGFEPKAEEEKEENAEKNGEAMEEEDYVIAEYDVYFNPRDTKTQLYVLQYPLRPLWRPYEMDQKCTEVRVKQESAEVEVDLLIDTDSDNYDPDAHTAWKMKKLTLSSPWRPPQAPGYAVGVLMGKKLCRSVHQWII